MKAKIKRKIKKVNKTAAKLLKASGLPSGYFTSKAWFSERMVLASLLLVALSFAAGVMFVLHLAEPIGTSEIYDLTAQRARLAEQGIKTFSQQVIDVASPVFAALISDNRDNKEISAKELALRKEQLKNYLQNKNSPFAADDGALTAFAVSKNMKLMVAISFVESTFGKNCYYFNCSGIGGTPPNLRKYNSYAEWIIDFDKLLEARYKDLAPEQFIGLYVQPGSPNWLYGVKQVLQELDEQGLVYSGN